MGENLDPNGKPQGGEDLELKGVSKLLNDLGIKDGIIPVKEMVKSEGSEEEVETLINKNFDELNEDVQYNVLKSIIDSNSEGKYELSETELNDIKTLRDKDTDLESFLNDTVEEKVNEAKAHYESQGEDYDKMPDDALHMLYLEQKYPDKTSEELRKEHNIAKDLSDYVEKNELIRSNFKEKEELKSEASAKVEAKKISDRIEAHRTNIVNANFDTEKVANWRVTKEDRQATYDDLLIVEDNGFSKFQNDIFDDEKELFKASFLYRNAENLFARQDRYYQTLINKAFQEGRRSNIDGSSSRQKPRESFVDTSKKPKNGNSDKPDYVDF